MDGSSPTDKRRGAERLLCILAVLTALLGRLHQLSEESAQEIATDLVQLIHTHHFIQVNTLPPAGMLTFVLHDIEP